MADDKWSRWLTSERWCDHRQGLQAALNAVRDRILGLAALQTGETVIDLGSGTGLLGLEAARLVGKGGIVVCLDISAPALRVASPNATVGCEALAVADAVALPLRNEIADVIVMRSV